MLQQLKITNVGHHRQNAGDDEITVDATDNEKIKPANTHTIPLKIIQ
ncbi:hypothetical protein [Neisseria sp.]